MDNTNRPIGEISVDTRILVDLLKEKKPGTLVTYEEMGKKIRRDVQNGARHLLYTALNILRREYGRNFLNIFGKGYKWASDVETLSEMERGEKHIRKTAKNSKARGACVQRYDDLSDDDKVRWNLGITRLSLHEQIASTKARKRLEAGIKQAQNHRLPERSAVEALMGYSKG